MRNAPAYFLPAISLLLALAVTPSAMAQTKAQKDATSAFRNCRDMEQFGDATPCWRLYLERHRNAGNEAEIMLAEERVGRPGGSGEAPPPKPDQVPPALDQPTPPAVVEPVPEAAPPEEAPAEAAPEGAIVPISVDGSDLCAKGKGVQKSAVIFGVAGTELLDADAKLKQAEGARHLTEVFLARFPNPRFRNVTTTLPGDPGWASATSLALADVKKHVTSRSEGEASTFLAKSLDCSDYVVFTTLTKFTGGAEMTASGKMGVFSRKGEQLERLGSFDAEVPSLFDRAEDEAAKTAAASLDASTSSLDSVNQAAANAQQLKDQAVDTASAVGDAAGQIAEGEVPGGITAGGESGEPKEKPPDVVEKPTLGAAHERMSSVCIEAQKTKDETKTLVCEVRVRAQMLARSFSESSVDLPGWQLSAPLVALDSDFGIALGDAEGLSVGDRFVVLDENGDRKAYFRVVDVGPGGSGGEGAPSRLSLRDGSAGAGDVVSEYSKLGLSIQLHGAAGFYFLDKFHYAPYGVISEDGENWVRQTFGLPALAAGGGAAIAFDMSSLIGWSEFSLRAGGDYLVGNGTASRAWIISTELLVEKGFYLGTGFEMYLGLGPAFTMAEVRAVPSYAEILLGTGEPPDTTVAATMPGQIVDYETTLFGGTALLGFELLFSPAFALRAEIPVRAHAPAGYETATPPTMACPSDLSDPSTVTPGQDSRVCWGFDQREDLYASVGLRLGALVTF